MRPTGSPSPSCSPARRAALSLLCLLTLGAGAAPAEPLDLGALRQETASLLDRRMLRPLAEAQRAVRQMEELEGRLPGRRVEGWRGWLQWQTRREGATSLGLIGLDPYGPEPPLRVQAPGTRERMHKLAVELKVQGDEARLSALRPGQEVRFSGTVRRAMLHTGILLVVDASELTLGPPPPVVAAPVPPDLLLRVRTRGCEGTCPIYEAQVDAAGELTFVGKLHVKATEGRARIDRQTLAALLGAFDRAGFDQLQDRYAHEHTLDLDWTYLTLRRGGKERSVAYYHGDCAAPGRLRILDAQVKEALALSRWAGP